MTSSHQLANATPIFRFDSFRHFPLTHGMSYRIPESPSSGDVGYARDANWDHVSDNRSRFLNAAGIDEEDLVVPRQTHGNIVQIARNGDRGKGQPPDFAGFPGTDGLVTDDSDVAIGIIVADCVPILLYDPVMHGTGVLHAGWRGTVAEIARFGVISMCTNFGSLPEHIWAGIGPSIGPCCYEVGDEVIEGWMNSSVTEKHVAVYEKQPRSHFDLWEANRQALIDCGLPKEHIQISGLCTSCQNDRLFSHRTATTGTGPRGRMMMVTQLH